MNKEQKTVVFNAIFVYVLAIAIFAMYYFDNPLLVMVALAIFAIFKGKIYKADNIKLKEKSMEDFIEYTKRHKGLLCAVALYSAVLPVLLFYLSLKNYIKIGTDSKAQAVFLLLAGIPFLLFDTAHRVYLYRKYEGLTEHGNQPDTD